MAEADKAVCDRDHTSVGTWVPAGQPPRKEPTVRDQTEGFPQWD